VEDSAGYKLMWKLGVVSDSQTELQRLDQLVYGMKVVLHQGGPAPCVWGTIPYPLPPERQIETGADGVDQFRLQQATGCVRLLRAMRKHTDLHPQRWKGGLYHQWELPSLHVMVWTTEHEKIIPFDSA
jgi:hypothetical protein